MHTPAIPPLGTWVSSAEEPAGTAMQHLHLLEEQAGLLPESFHGGSKEHHPGPDVLCALDQAALTCTRPWARTSSLAAAGAPQAECSWPCVSPTGFLKASTCPVPTHAQINAVTFFLVLSFGSQFCSSRSSAFPSTRVMSWRMACSKAYMTYIGGQGQFQLIWFASMLENPLDAKKHVSPGGLITFICVCPYPCRRCMSQQNVVREELDNEHLFSLKRQLDSKRS